MTKSKYNPIAASSFMGVARFGAACPPGASSLSVFKMMVQ
jgi:hypothetical protein